MTTDPHGPLLSVQDLTLRFGIVTALAPISFDIAAGMIYGVTGPSSAGKTALLNCIAGLFTPSAGTILFADAPLSHESVRSKIRRVSSCDSRHFVFSPLLSVRQAMREGEDRSNPVSIDRLLAVLGLAAIADQPVATLDAATTQRTALGAALAGRPKLLLLDCLSRDLEALDLESLAALLRRLPRALGVTILIADRDAGFIASIADRVMVLQHGHMVMEGLPTDCLGPADRRGSFDDTEQ